MRRSRLPATAAAMARRCRIDLVLGFVLGLVIAVTSGCDAILGGELNPVFCAAHPADLECQRTFPDAAPDGPKLCMASSECQAPTAVCDLEGGRTCVQCTTSESTACTTTTPVCVANQCQRCTAHTQCPASNVCLADGACAAPEDVAYVAPAPAGTDSDACTKQAPCTKVKKALATRRPNLKLSGTIDEAVSISDQNVTLFADVNAVLTSSTLNGVVLEIRGSSRVAIYDLEIAGALGAGIGVSLPASATANVELRRAKLTNNAGGGISAAGGTLTVAQSTIRGNQGGGISIIGGTVFTITDNFIVSNGLAIGATPSLNGGVVVSSNTPGSKLERNTIAFNQSSGAIFPGGVFCGAALVGASGNLIYHNSVADQAGTGLKTDLSTQRNTTGPGICQYGTSLAVAIDAGNLGFASVVPPTDFHLTAASPATVVDAGGACSGIDVDGDTRPNGAACDLGADEYDPPGP